jgi:hypothetical protein
MPTGFRNGYVDIHKISSYYPKVILNINCGTSAAVSTPVPSLLVAIPLSVIWYIFNADNVRFQRLQQARSYFKLVRYLSYVWHIIYPVYSDTGGRDLTTNNPRTSAFYRNFNCDSAYDLNYGKVLSVNKM